MTVRFNPRELLTLAIQIEKNGYAYYTRMAAQAKDAKVRSIMQGLALAEQQHVTDFQKIEAALKPADYDLPDDYQNPDMETYLRSLADGKVFSNLVPVEEIAAEIKSDLDAIRHALSFEKDSIIFFSEIHDLLPAGEPNRAAVAELIRQEKIHIAQLYALMEGRK